MLNAEKAYFVVSSFRESQERDSLNDSHSRILLRQKTAPCVWEGDLGEQAVQPSVWWPTTASLPMRPLVPSGHIGMVSFDTISPIVGFLACYCGDPTKDKDTEPTGFYFKSKEAMAFMVPAEI